MKSTSQSIIESFENIAESPCLLHENQQIKFVCFSKECKVLPKEGCKSCMLENHHDCLDNHNITNFETLKLKDLRKQKIKDKLEQVYYQKSHQLNLIKRGLLQVFEIKANQLNSLKGEKLKELEQSTYNQAKNLSQIQDQSKNVEYIINDFDIEQFKEETESLLNKQISKFLEKQFLEDFNVSFDPEFTEVCKYQQEIRAINKRNGAYHSIFNQPLNKTDLFIFKLLILNCDEWTGFGVVHQINKEKGFKQIFFNKNSYGIYNKFTYCEGSQVDVEQQFQSFQNNDVIEVIYNKGNLTVHNNSRTMDDRSVKVNDFQYKELYFFVELFQENSCVRLISSRVY